MFKKNSLFLQQGQFLPALNALEQGKIIAFDTDTVPGLAANAFNKNAVEKLYSLKNRCSEKKIVWMIDDWERFSHHFSVSTQTHRLSQMLWPGPFTLIFHHRQGYKQAVRIPQDDYLLKFFSKCSFPLAVTSANKSGESAANSLEQVWNIFGEKIAFYLPHKVNSTKKPSLVVDLSDDECNILRQGDKKMLQKLQRCMKKVDYSSYSP